MLLSVHIASVAPPKAIAGLRAKPKPEKIQGLRYAETWLVNPLRTGALPSTGVKGVALIATWDDDESLDKFLHHPLASVYENGWHARFEPIRMVGSWPGMTDVPRGEKTIGDEPVAVLTMARLRLARSGSFARAAGPAEREAARHPAFLEGTNLLRPPGMVATFTLWRNTKEMRKYTVGNYPGGHRDAMNKHDEKVFHHETAFVRLRPYAVEGLWNGRNPLEDAARPQGRPPMTVAKAKTNANSVAS